MFLCITSMCCILDSIDEKQILDPAKKGQWNKRSSRSINEIEAEVEAQCDIDLGEINTKLLEKIEELTLISYICRNILTNLKNRKE